MLFFLLFLLLGFITFLFCLYILGKDDTLLIRRNVSLENLFNLAFMTVTFGFFFARLFFVLFNFDPVYFNPLVFFFILNYPGLSFPGALFMGSLFVLFYARKKKYPLGHIVDFFGLSFLCAMPFGYAASVFIEPFNPFRHTFLPSIALLLFVIAAVFLLPRTHRHELKTGTLGASSILVVSFINVLANIFGGVDPRQFSFVPADILSIITFVFALVFFVKQEYILSKVKNNMDQLEPSIVYEDDALLVVNKPAGMTVNVAETTEKGSTLQEWAEKYLQIANGSPRARLDSARLGEAGTWQIEDENDFVQRGGIVHRLDKETSGILLIAKTPDSFLELQRQFKERLVEKEYVALAHGEVTPQSGEIRVPVGRLPWNRRQFGVVAGGREAVTQYKTTSHFTYGGEKLTLLALHPETGRTHQIRVHLKYIGYPIFADFLYAGRKTSRDDRKLLSRVFLHAAGIHFFHPTTKEKVQFTAPLPQELSHVLEELGKVA